MFSISPNVTNKSAIDETLLVTATEAGQWLNLSPSMITMQTAKLEMLIRSATETIEKYLWMALRRTTYIADFDLGVNNFMSFITGSVRLSLERAPIINLDDITKIEYLDTDGTYKEFARGTKTAEGLYDNTTEKKESRKWASIYFKETIPFDTSRINAYKIKITFIAGFTISTDIVTDLPESIKTALLMIVAMNYSNRGDCVEGGCNLNGYPAPCAAVAMLEQYTIRKTMLGSSYTPYRGAC